MQPPAASIRGFYSQYLELRQEIVESACFSGRAGGGPRQVEDCLQRILFVRLCEAHGLVAQGSVERCLGGSRKQIWGRLHELLGPLDHGFAGISTTGLFLPLTGKPEALSARGLELLQQVCSYNLATDFGADVLGYVIEHFDDELLADTKTHAHTRRRQGVFYTPSHIATHLVDQTLGRWFAQTRASLGLHARSPIATWEAYRTALGNLRILDPACGAGSLLAEAFTRILNEHTIIQENLSRLRGRAEPSVDGFEVIKNNLYGLDNQARAIRGAACCLWLRAAKFGGRRARGFNLVHGNALFDDPKIIEHALKWETAFPEVTRVGGFDVILGNPPYDVLAGRELGQPLGPVLDAIARDPVLKQSIHGKHNLYKLFLCRALAWVRPGGWMSMIVPLSLLGDRQARGVRRYLFEQSTIEQIDCFPQKDDRKRRVFEDAKQATVIVTVRRNTQPDPNAEFALFTHNGRSFEMARDRAACLTPRQIRELSPVEWAIPMCAGADWAVVQKVRRRSDFQELGTRMTQRQGEVNETMAKQFLRTQGKGAAILRGANLTRYCVREASQGVTYWLDRPAFVAGKTSLKVHDGQYPRVGFQRSAPANNYRRLIAARLAKGSHCFDTVSYVTEPDSEIPLDALIGLLNSALYEWWFRLLSTNSKVNKYQFDLLPMVAFSGKSGAAEAATRIQQRDWQGLVVVARRVRKAPAWGLTAIAQIACAITKLEKRRKLKDRKARARLGPKATELQHHLDNLIFALFGLNQADAKYVRGRLDQAH